MNYGGFDKHVLLQNASATLNGVTMRGIVINLLLLLY
jgi:hypothetical protein